MTNEQIEAYISGRDCEELLAREVWVAHLQYPESHGVLYADEIVEPRIKVTKECVEQVLMGDINDCFSVEVDRPPRRRRRVCWVKVMNDERLYYPFEVFLTEAEARRVARRKVAQMVGEFRDRLIGEVGNMSKRIDFARKRIKLFEKWIDEHADEQKGCGE